MRLTTKIIVIIRNDRCGRLIFYFVRTKHTKATNMTRAIRSKQQQQKERINSLPCKWVWKEIAAALFVFKLFFGFFSFLISFSFSGIRSRGKCEHNYTKTHHAVLGVCVCVCVLVPRKRKYLIAISGSVATQPPRVETMAARQWSSTTERFVRRSPNATAKILWIGNFLSQQIHHFYVYHLFSLPLSLSLYIIWNNSVSYGVAWGARTEDFIKAPHSFDPCTEKWILDVRNGRRENGWAWSLVVQLKVMRAVTESGAHSRGSTKTW